MPIKVLFLVKKRLDYGFYGYGMAYGLANSANFVVNFLNDSGIETKIETAIDSNDIDRLVTEYDPTHVVIEAIWVPPSKFREILKFRRHQKRRWIVRIHSKLSFLANEGNALNWINEYKHMVIAPNTEELANDLHDLMWLRTTYLPNLYYPSKLEQYPEMNVSRDSSIIDVGCFGAVRPMKNHLTQAFGAMKFANDLGKRLRFHINSTRTEQAGEQVLKNMRALFDKTRHSLVEHQWMSHQEFIRIVGQMDVGTQVSLTETFNIVAADFVSQNKPILGSDQISWLPWLCKVKDSNSSENVRDGLAFVHKYHNWGLNKLNNTYLNWSNKKAGKLWLDYLKG